MAINKCMLGPKKLPAPLDSEKKILALTELFYPPPLKGQMVHP